MTDPCFQSKGHRPIDLRKIKIGEAPILHALVIYTTIQRMQGNPVCEEDLPLYASAINAWLRSHPDYVDVFAEINCLVYDALKNKREIPDFARAFVDRVFSEIRQMVG